MSGFIYPLCVLAAVAVALAFPQFFLSIGGFELKRLIVPLLQLIMFGMGSQMSLADFRGVARMPRGALVGLAAQFSIMPAVGLALAKGFGLPAEIAAGVLLVGCSPSGLASNVMAFLARANLALSVTLTACSTLLAPLMTPLLMQTLAGEYVAVDFWKMMTGIVNMVIYPIVAGLMFNVIGYRLFSRRSTLTQAASFLVVVVAISIALSLAPQAPPLSPVDVLMNLAWFAALPAALGWFFGYVVGGRKQTLDRVLALGSMIGIAVIIVVISAAGRDNLLQVGLVLVLVCTIHNVFGYLIGYWGCRLLGLEERSCRTIALEVGMQNSGLASGIALQMGKVATLGLAPMVFGPLMNITGSILATRWRKQPD